MAQNPQPPNRPIAPVTAPSSPGSLPTPYSSQTAPTQPSAASVVVDMQTLTQIIAATVAQVLAGMPANTPSLDVAALGAAISTGIANSTRRLKTIGEYIAERGNSGYRGRNKKAELRNKCFQNAGEMNAATLFDEEIELLNRITHSGRYIGRLVEVAVTAGGEALDLRYNNKPAGNIALRDKFAQRAPGSHGFLHDMLWNIVKEQDVLDQDAEDMEAESRRGREARRAAREAREASAQA